MIQIRVIWAAAWEVRAIMHGERRRIEKCDGVAFAEEREAGQLPVRVAWIPDPSPGHGIW
jgi:hypothetical protein